MTNKETYAMKRQTLNTLLAGAVTFAALGAISPAHAMLGENEEKCYGVVKAGQNGCGSADGAHSCGGQAAADGMGTEWVAVPKGLCAKLVNGSVEPVTPKAEGETTPDAKAE